MTRPRPANERRRASKLPDPSAPDAAPNPNPSPPAPRGPRAWFRGRSYRLAAQLDTFLVCAASGVVINRAVLIALGYPQIGSRGPGGIHISHSIYGGFSMMIAVTVAIAFLAPATRWFVAIVGGFGFGWYVDELGKYVSNAGYLFRPALALIYVVFVVMFLAFNALAGRAYTADDAVLNALESLKGAALGTLDERQRQEVSHRLARSGADSDLAREVLRLLEQAPTAPPRPPGRWQRARRAVRERYLQFSRWRGFTLVIELFFIVFGLSSLGAVVGLTLDGPGFNRASGKVAVIAELVAGVCVIIGLLVLPRRRLLAFRWFDRGLIIRILVVQVFLFDEQQFAAVIGLAVDLVVWIMLRTAMTMEEQRRELPEHGRPAPRPATTS